MTADARLVDARTGAVILSHPNLMADVRLAGGLVGPAVQSAIESARGVNNTDQLADAWGATYRDWLLRKA
jgi:hypothetical protein